MTNPIEHTDWMPDLFAWLYDRLEAEASQVISGGWADLACEEELPLCKALRDAPDGAAPWSVLVYLQGGAAPGGVVPSLTSNEVLHRYFVVARCLDEVCALIHPRWCQPNLPGGLRQIWSHFHGPGRGRYNRSVAGLVLPHAPLWPAPTRRGTSGDRLDQLFRSLQRVPPGALVGAEPCFERIPERDDFSPEELERPAPLKIAIVPWAEEADDLLFTSRLHGAQPRLQVEVTAGAEARMTTAAEALVAMLAAAGVAVAVLPELVVPPGALDALRSALGRWAASHDDFSLGLVVAGTGLSTARDAATGLPFNECTVLARTGRVLWRQRKLNHYAMSPLRMRQYGFGDRILDPSLDHLEDICTGKVLEIRDGRLGRMAVLVCEDLAQPRPGDALLDHFRPDWVFAPVLDGELQVGRWVHQRGWQAASRFCTNVLVATSLVLGRREHGDARTLAVGLGVAGSDPRNVLTLRVNLDDPALRMATAAWDPGTWPACTLTVPPGG